MDMVVDLTDDAAVDLSSHHGSTPTISQNGCTKSVDSPGKENLYENGIYANLTHSELIKNLQCDLRNEETKLLLLRKIRSSQAVAISPANKATPPSNLNGQARPAPYKTSPGGATTGQRPGITSLLKPKSLMKSPLVGVAERIVSVVSSQQQPTPAASRSVPSVPSSQQQPQQQQQQQHRPQVSNSAAAAAASDPRMVAWMNQQRQLNQQSQWSQQQQQQQQQQRLVAQKPPAPSAETVRQQLQQQQQQKQLLQKAAAASEAQLLAQRQQAAQQAQANAKQTLRKQLELTLLQIPPPKPPPPTLVLVPNAASAEFVVLLGLDECVRAAERRRNTGGEEKPWSSPPVCRQCGTDFTPVWTQADVEDGKKGAGDGPAEGSAKSGGFICEHCVTSNRKRALKQEHTNRLKSAFVKALQQEQAIERSLQQSMPESSVGRVTGVQQFKAAPNNTVQQMKSVHGGGGQQTMRSN